jgi:hypothetical protein
VLVAGCRSNPNRAEKIETALTSADRVSGGESVGVRKGEMVVQEQARASERLRDLQNAVYALEDKVYGTRKLGSEGLYGQLRQCKRQLASKAYGGDGTLTWTEPLDRVTDKEEEAKLGLNEKNELIGLNREYLRDRLTRFLGYKMILQKRADEYALKIETCEADRRARRADPQQSDAVVEKDAPANAADRLSINTYMCGYVRAGASLRDLMLTAFARGWLSLTDFRADQNLIAAELRDAKLRARPNALLFNGWKLSFDTPGVTLGELLAPSKDARLVAWTTAKVRDGKGAGPNVKTCLPAGEGIWNE